SPRSAPRAFDASPYASALGGEPRVVLRAEGAEARAFGRVGEHAIPGRPLGGVIAETVPRDDGSRVGGPAVELDGEGGVLLERQAGSRARLGNPGGARAGLVPEIEIEIDREE